MKLGQKSRFPQVFAGGGAGAGIRKKARFSLNGGPGRSTCTLQSDEYATAVKSSA